MALLRAIGASRRAGDCVSMIGESVVVGVVASRIGVGRRHRCSRSGSRRCSNAVGFDIPGQRRRDPDPAAIVIGFLVGTIVTVALGDRARAAGGACPAGRRDARRRARAPSTGRGPRTAIGLAVTARRRRLDAVGAVRRGDNAHRRPSDSARSSIFVGVFVLGPLFARLDQPVHRRAARPGSRASRARSPARTRPATRSAPRRPRPALMIGVALVGFITIFAASAKASIRARDRRRSSDRLHRHQRQRDRLRRCSGLSPTLEGIAALPEIGAVAAVRCANVGARRHGASS